MYITSLSVNGCEYHLTISFSSTKMVLHIIKLYNLTTQNACLLYYVILKQAFQYKTKEIYCKMGPKERDLLASK